MKYILNTLLTVLLASSVALGQSTFSIEHVYPIERTHSYLQFVATYMGYAKVRGSFDEFNGSIYYDPSEPEKTSVSFNADVSSLDSNSDWRDKDLKSANWFDAEQFPTLTFVSNEAKVEDGSLQVTGDLHLKGQTQSITVKLNPVIGVMQDTRGDDQVIFSGSHVLSRKSFGIEGRGWSAVKEGLASLSDEVEIEFSFLAKQINLNNATNFVRNTERPPGKMYQAYKENGIDGVKSTFNELQKSMEVNHHLLNAVGYVVLKSGKPEDALIIFQMNQETFPDEPNVYDSLGAVHLHLDQPQSAKTNYQKSLELNPSNYHAKEILRHL